MQIFITNTILALAITVTLTMSNHTAILIYYAFTVVQLSVQYPLHNFEDRGKRCSEWGWFLNALEIRRRKGQPFAFCAAELDNFIIHRQIIQ